MYVTHTRVPRFVAEIFPEDAAPIDGITFSMPGSREVIGNIVWIDDPGAHDLSAIMSA